MRFILTSIIATSLLSTFCLADGRILNLGIDKHGDFDENKGKVLYEKNCASCHGIKGEKRAYNSSRKLSELSVEDMDAAFRKYNGDFSYGGKYKTLMQNALKKLNYNDLGQITSYIKGKDAMIEMELNMEENKAISDEPTEDGIYLE